MNSHRFYVFRVEGFWFWIGTRSQPIALVFSQNDKDVSRLIPSNYGVPPAHRTSAAELSH